MNTAITQPIYQEAMSINRTIQKLVRGYHSNGTFNLAFKIKDDIRCCFFDPWLLL